MAWTAPMTAVTNAVLTAAQWNANVRDNFAETAAAKATTAGSIFASTGTNTLAERIPTIVSVTATETTASTSFTDLDTTGPAATVTSGPKTLMLLAGSLSNNTVNADAYMGVEISGATTASPSTAAALVIRSSTANARQQASYCVMYALTAGSNTFTAKYQVSSGTGSFSNRRMSIVPF